MATTGPLDVHPTYAGIDGWIKVSAHKANADLISRFGGLLVHNGPVN